MTIKAFQDISYEITGGEAYAEAQLGLYFEQSEKELFWRIIKGL